MHRDGKWARSIIELQDAEGKWGRFHSMAASSGCKFTTEMALGRLERLGFTIEDDCIRKAVDYMTDCLSGKKEIPDPREKLHDWDIFTSLMLAARIRRFTKDVPAANAVAEKWAQLVTAAFSGGAYDHDAYVRTYHDIMGLKPKGGRLIDFVNFYPVSLLGGMLDAATENRFVKYVLDAPGGIYYIYDKPLRRLPESFEGKTASRYIAAIELLADYRNSASQLEFARDWLVKSQSAPGKWDLGSAAGDRAYFPLSDSWRRAETRIADCTERISGLLGKLR